MVLHQSISAYLWCYLNEFVWFKQLWVWWSPSWDKKIRRNAKHAIWRYVITITFQLIWKLPTQTIWNDCIDYKLLEIEIYVVTPSLHISDAIWICLCHLNNTEFAHLNRGTKKYAEKQLLQYGILSPSQNNFKYGI